VRQPTEAVLKSGGFDDAARDQRQEINLLILRVNTRADRDAGDNRDRREVLRAKLRSELLPNEVISPADVDVTAADVDRCLLVYEPGMYAQYIPVASDLAGWRPKRANHFRRKQLSP